MVSRTSLRRSKDAIGRGGLEWLLCAAVSISECWSQPSSAVPASLMGACVGFVISRLTKKRTNPVADWLQLQASAPKSVRAEPFIDKAPVRVPRFPSYLRRTWDRRHPLMNSCPDANCAVSVVFAPTATGSLIASLRCLLMTIPMANR